jgi:hypothetical protein
MQEISFNTPTKTKFAGSKTVKAIYFRLFEGIGKIFKVCHSLVSNFEIMCFLKVV